MALELVEARQHAREIAGFTPLAIQSWPLLGGDGDIHLALYELDADARAELTARTEVASVRPAREETYRDISGAVVTVATSNRYLVSANDRNEYPERLHAYAAANRARYEATLPRAASGRASFWVQPLGYADIGARRSGRLIQTPVGLLDELLPRYDEPERHFNPRYRVLGRVLPMDVPGEIEPRDVWDTILVMVAVNRTWSPGSTYPVYAEFETAERAVRWARFYRHLNAGRDVRVLDETGATVWDATAVAVASYEGGTR